MTKWTRADLGTEQKLESLLRKLQKDLTDMEQRNLARIAQLRTDLDTQVRSIWSSTTSQVNAIQGAVSRALAAVPGDISVYDEENNQWLDNPNASGTQAGIVTTGTQTFAGNKTFTGSVRIDSSLSVGEDIILTKATAHLYYGDPNTNNEWRVTTSDSSYNVQYREAGSWVNKWVVTP